MQDYSAPGKYSPIILHMWIVGVALVAGSQMQDRPEETQSSRDNKKNK